MARVKTKRIYEPKEPGDGTRILVMRRWPRGIKKSHVDGWLKKLGAEPPLIKAWKAGKISWPEFRRRYLAGLKKGAAQAQLQELQALAKEEAVTLLCSCPDEARCHRGLLKQRLIGSGRTGRTRVRAPRQRPTRRARRRPRGRLDA